MRGSLCNNKASEMKNNDIVRRFFLKKLTMRTLYNKIFSTGSTLITVLLFASWIQAQDQPRITVIATRGPHPAWEGTASGNPQPFIRNNDDLRIAVLTQPVPEIWLEFAESRREGQPPRLPSDQKEPVIQVVLPSEATEILKSFWEQSLEFDYKEAFAKPKTAQEGMDRDLAWINYFRTTAQKLEKIEIAAPDGRRKISDEEATRLVAFLRKISGNLVKSVKQ